MRLLTDQRHLLGCGLVAGPLFVSLTTLQSVARTDHDFLTDPISLLSLGDLGWIQIGNFVVTGLLVAAFAVGLWRADVGRSAPVLTGVAGGALVAVGVFVTDRPGVAMTWHGAAHSVATAVAINAGLAACLLFALRQSRTGWRGRAAYSALTVVAASALGWSQHTPTIGLRHTAVAVVLTLWVSLVALQVRRAITAPQAANQ